MPHSHKPSRANLGAGTKPRNYAQGQSVSRANAAARAKLLHTSKAPIKDGPRVPESRFAGRRKGPTQIRFASSAQEEAFNYGPFPLAASGGFGASKTYGLCLKAMYLSSIYPGNRGLIARKQVKKLEMTTMKTFFKVCPQEAYQYGSRSDQAKRLVLNNGSEIIWSQLDDSEILELLRGLEINWFIIDQAEEVSEEIFEVLLRRLGRWDQAEVPQYLIDAEHAAGREWPWMNGETGAPLPPTYAMIACNPDHELHWIYRRFHEKSPEWAETYSKEGYKMIHFDSTKNIFLPNQNKDALLKGTREFVARFVRGEWGIPEGQIHKIDPMSILKMTPELEHYIFTQCKLSRTLDHGETSPTCCIWWALDKYGNLFAFREYYQPDRLISYHRQRIWELSHHKITKKVGGSVSEEEVLEVYASEIADPSIFNPRTQRGVSVSVAEEYLEINEAKTDKYSAIWWQRGDNNELGTRNRINELLKLDKEHKHPFSDKMGAPRLYFIERTSSWPHGCAELIRETRSARRIKVGTQDGKDVFSDDRDESIVDHAYDCASGDTRVVTSWGEIQIKDLPESGVVLAPGGWRPYSHCQKYRENAEVVEVLFADGRSVTTTPDHLFLTTDGWVRADQLTNRIVCDIRDGWIPQSSPQPSSVSLDSTTTGVDSISSEEVSVSTESFGKTLTDRPQKAITFTTRTRTELTTVSETSGAYSGQLISRSTRKESHTRKLWQRCRKQLKRGIEVLLGWFGTKNTIGSRLPQSTLVTFQSVVSSAANDSSPLEPKSIVPSFAGVDAGPLVSVSGVRVTTVRPKSPEDVYCLTVDDADAAFCVEGGIVIHNCLRYRVADMDSLPVEAIRRPGPGTVAHTIAEFKRSDTRKGRIRVDGASRLADWAKLPPTLRDFMKRNPKAI